MQPERESEAPRRSVEKTEVCVELANVLRPSSESPLQRHKVVKMEVVRTPD